MEKRFVAAFDVDGTLYRGSLLGELVNQLVIQKSFPDKAKTEFRDAEAYWQQLRHRESYAQYTDKLVATLLTYMKGMAVSEMKDAAGRVVDQSVGLVYKYGETVIRQVQDTHHLIAISGSPIEVVAPFVKRLGIETVHATEFEIRDDRYTGEVIHVGARNKDETLQRLVKRNGLILDENSLAMGDTDSDIPMLALVTRAIAFNANKELFEYAMRKKWEIVYERKDMILHLEDGVFGVEDGNLGHFRQRAG